MDDMKRRLIDDINNKSLLLTKALERDKYQLLIKKGLFVSRVFPTKYKIYQNLTADEKLNLKIPKEVEEDFEKECGKLIQSYERKLLEIREFKLKLKSLAQIFNGIFGYSGSNFKKYETCVKLENYIRMYDMLKKRANLIVTRVEISSLSKFVSLMMSYVYGMIFDGIVTWSLHDYTRKDIIERSFCWYVDNEIRMSHAIDCLRFGYYGFQRDDIVIFNPAKNLEYTGSADNLILKKLKTYQYIPYFDDDKKTSEKVRKSSIYVKCCDSKQHGGDGKMNKIINIFADFIRMFSFFDFWK